MFLLDVNVLAYAYRPTQSVDAQRVADWLAGRMDAVDSVAVSTQVLSGLVRLTTHPRVFEAPASPRDATRFAQAVIDTPGVRVVVPSSRHWPVFRMLVDDLRLVGNDVPDAYLAALALDHGATLVTTDRGFRRFPGLRLVDPLAA